MTVRLTVLLCILSAVLAAGLTYHFMPVQTKVVEKDIVHNNIITVTHTVTKPSGETDTTTTVTDHSQHLSNSTNITALPKPKWNVSALIANDFSHGNIVPTYGASAQKEFIGPITIGAFGLTNGTIGVSIGLDFQEI